MLAVCIWHKYGFLNVKINFFYETEGFEACGEATKKCLSGLLDRYNDQNLSFPNEFIFLTVKLFYN